MEPAPLKGKIGYRLRNDFSKEDVAALKLWLESKNVATMTYHRIHRGKELISFYKEDWKEGWSDVNK